MFYYKCRYQFSSRRRPRVNYAQPNKSLFFIKNFISICQGNVPNFGTHFVQHFFKNDLSGRIAILFIAVKNKAVKNCSPAACSFKSLFKCSKHDPNNFLNNDAILFKETIHFLFLNFHVFFEYRELQQSLGRKQNFHD